MVAKQIFHLRPDGEKAFGYAQAVKVGNILHLAGALSVNDAFEPQHPGDMIAQVASV
jgi:2-iminobutanoate/2-iminopropanoate deaminase